MRSTTVGKRAPFSHAGRQAAGCAPRLGACKANRRQAVQTGLAALLIPGAAHAAAEKPKVATGPITSELCDSACESMVSNATREKTSTGLEYVDIVTGKGPKPQKGFQVAVNYIAMTSDGKVFDSSFEKGRSYDIRYGAESVIPGLDQGLTTMRPGGVRRLFVPGNLAFPKPLAAAAGRPRVPANSPLIFDVQFLYQPGFEDLEEGEYE